MGRRGGRELGAYDWLAGLTASCNPIIHLYDTRQREDNGPRTVSIAPKIAGSFAKKDESVEAP